MKGALHGCGVVSRQIEVERGEKGVVIFGCIGQTVFFEPLLVNRLRGNVLPVFSVDPVFARFDSVLRSRSVGIRIGGDRSVIRRFVGNVHDIFFKRASRKRAYETDQHDKSCKQSAFFHGNSFFVLS
jgi:hypothetical protein